MEEIYRMLKENQEKVDKQRQEMRKRIVGLSDFIESLLICFYSHSEKDLVPHILVEGKVGRGKTTALKAFTQTISDATFSRIQFSPDLQPIDLVSVTRRLKDGTYEDRPGPLIANLVLADEINRAHEKTRSTLLEAMGEEQVTVLGDTHRMDRPFFVMATENPIDVEGTFMLGAAQLDRFMMKVDTMPLSEEEEIRIAEMHQQKTIELKPVITKTEILDIRNFIRENILVDPKIRRDMIRIVRSLREDSKLVDPEDFYLLPEGERGYLFLERGAKVKAFFEGRNHVIPRDVDQLAFPILNHRIGWNISKEKDRIQKTRELISRAVEGVIGRGARGA